MSNSQAVAGLAPAPTTKPGFLRALLLRNISAKLAATPMILTVLVVFVYSATAVCLHDWQERVRHHAGDRRHGLAA